MRGWRGRIGIIFPSDEVQEDEYWKLAPKGVSIHPTRIEISSEITIESVTQILEGEDLEKAVRLFNIISPHVIIFACTSGSFVQAHGYDQTIINRIEKISGAKATTTSTATIAALQALGLRPVDVFTPYTDELNDRLRLFLESHDIVINSIKGMQITEKIYKISPEEVYKFVVENATEDSAGVFISCTNLRTLEVLPILESDLDKPVISANQASLWHALKLMNIKEQPRENYRLFERL